MNQDLIAFGEEDRYVTLLLGILDSQTHTLTVVRAGHPAPIIRRSDGSLENLAQNRNGMVLGYDPQASYLEETTQLAPGDLVIVFSDGITEAMDASGRWFGDQRLKEALRQASLSAELVGRGVLNAVRRFVDGHAQSDDITMVCLSRMPDPSVEPDDGATVFGAQGVS
jgi:serine phosphatase RsbU (regulator of sigma subunit)